MAKINLEKIEKELSKGNSDEKIEAYQKIKAFIASSIQAEQEELQDRATDLQNKIESIKGV